MNRRIGSYLLFAALWLAGAILFALSNHEFSYETLSRTVTPWESFRNGVWLLTAEVVVLLAMLRPSTFDNSWSRVLATLVVTTCWFMFLTLSVMHAPEWFLANLLWLMGVLVGLVVTGVVCATGAFCERRS